MRVERMKALGILNGALALVCLAWPARAQFITEFRIPTSGSQPLQIAPGPGGMWFTEDGANRVGLIAPGGQVSEFPVNRPAQSIVAGPDGNLWFTSDGFLSRMTPSGVVTDFPISGRGWGITVGPDHDIWFTGIQNTSGIAYGILGRATAAGQVTEVLIGAWAESITPGPDGNFWLPDWTEVAGDAIVRVTPSGVETRFLLPGGLHGPGDVGPAAVVVGSDGNVWFTEVRTAQIGRVTPSGGVAVFNAPGGWGIASGRDGNIWFTDSANKIGRMTTQGDYVEFGIPTANAQPWGISAGSDGNIWFTERGAGQIGRITLGSDADVLRLDGGRFLVTVGWQSPAGSGSGHPVSLTPQAGYFWFSDPANVEVIVKILDWCPAGGIKFFAAGLTNFRVEMDVTDTHTGLSKHYTNPQGVAFQPVEDNFSSCAPGSPGSIEGVWTGTYNNLGYDEGCDPSVNYPAQATFQQDGAAVRGTVSSAGSCSLDTYGTWAFTGTLPGNTLSGSILSTSNFQFNVLGTLTGSTLEIQIVSVGQMHLHR
jgi:virginiamycin B lyase